MRITGGLNAFFPRDRFTCSVLRALLANTLMRCVGLSPT